MAIPIFIMFLLGLVELGTGMLQTSQATSAAADGARAGIMWSNDPLHTHNLQDVAGSPDNNKIVAAAKARVVSSRGTISVTANCVGPSGSAVKSCATANPTLDRLHVVVTWTWKPITFIGTALPIQTIKGDTTMALIGLPSEPVPVTIP